MLLLGPVAWWIGGEAVTSLTGKPRADAINAVRQLILATLVGIGAIAGLYFTARTYLLSKSGQVTDRFSKAVDHIGSEKIAQQVGGVYALERIMRDSAEDRQTIVEVLTAFIRDNVGHQPDWIPEEEIPQTHLEVQAALTVLARRPEIDHELQLDLARVAIAHCYLNEARFEKANLSKADLRHSHFFSAKLQGVRMGGSRLQGAHLRYADLQHAHLGGTRLQNADLNRANLKSADLSGAHLEGAKLCHADLSYANLKGAYFDEKTNLTGAVLTGARLRTAHGLSAASLKLAIIDPSTELPQGLCISASDDNGTIPVSAA